MALLITAPAWNKAARPLVDPPSQLSLEGG